MRLPLEAQRRHEEEADRLRSELDASRRNEEQLTMELRAQVCALLIFGARFFDACCCLLHLQYSYNFPSNTYNVHYPTIARALPELIMADTGRAGRGASLPGNGSNGRSGRCIASFAQGRRCRVPVQRGRDARGLWRFL